MTELSKEYHTIQQQNSGHSYHSKGDGTIAKPEWITARKENKNKDYIGEDLRNINNRGEDVLYINKQRNLTRNSTLFKGRKWQKKKMKMMIYNKTSVNEYLTH